MIIWQGYGILVIVFTGVGLLVGQTIGGATGLPTGYWIALGFFIAGVMTWIVGKRLGRAAQASARKLVDPKTGEHVEVRTKHTLIFVPMAFWSYPLLLGALLSIYIEIWSGNTLKAPTSTPPASVKKLD